ncbi:DNA-binding response regulator, OmpR family, contains REC and winged-helix (wHTH) domain [Lachnospiraceae bacterium KH1T2]|nr:DNA-binding response regulator, OmpR family, contains REC and winged-helix (wHTH) domain [Lachnospiraceae bacterium KH1T2]
MKILIAEDTKDMNRVLTVALEHEGYDVDSCLDGEDALEHAMSNGYDAMIMDIMMPKMDGISVLRKIRDKNIVTPVLLLTAKAEVDDRVTGLDAGADDYLTKPFAIKELFARVRAMTRRKREYNKEKLVYGDISLDGESFELQSENSVRLSVKEFELLQTMILNAERNLDDDYLLKHVWDNSTDATVNTVSLYIAYLKSKLTAISSTVNIVKEETGYRLTYGE